MSIEQLKLENQLCFPLYALSRLITKEYHPLLSKLNLTYPQYLVLLVLWENDGKTITEISERLMLNTNTTTPLLQRMERDEIIYREKAIDDDRKIKLFLTEKGKALEIEAECIPEKLINKLKKDDLSSIDLIQFRNTLNELIRYIK